MNSPLGRLDHLASVVRDPDEVLNFYRDTLGLAVRLSQVLPDLPIRLTRPDTGTPVERQLVQPLRDDPPMSVCVGGPDSLATPVGRLSS